MHCRITLPETKSWEGQNQAVEKVFWGRVDIEYAVALYFFGKGTRVQRLIHHLKYHKRKDVGIYLGRHLGTRVKNKCNLDIIVPVPLFKERRRRRGYNQSEMIGQGLADVLEYPMIPNILRRIHATDTQTHHTRYDRWENVRQGFCLNSKAIVSGKHILLVDDVITTGATLEACATVLLDHGAASVSIAAIAITDS